MNELDNINKVILQEILALATLIYETHLDFLTYDHAYKANTKKMYQSLGFCGSSEEDRDKYYKNIKDIQKQIDAAKEYLDEFPDYFKKQKEKAYQMGWEHNQFVAINDGMGTVYVAPNKNYWRVIRPKWVDEDKVRWYEMRHPFTNEKVAGVYGEWMEYGGIPEAINI